MHCRLLTGVPSYCSVPGLLKNNLFLFPPKNQARTELLALVGQLYTSLRSRFDAEDTAAVFLWVEKFSRNPWSGEIRPGGAGGGGS